MTTLTQLFSLFFLVFTFKKKSFQQLFPNQPVVVALVCSTLVCIHFEIN